MIDPTDPEYAEFRAELVAAVAMVRQADEAATVARRRRAEAILRARTFGLTHGDSGRFVGVTRHQAHAWDALRVNFRSR